MPRGKESPAFYAEMKEKDAQRYTAHPFRPYLSVASSTKMCSSRRACQSMRSLTP